MNVRISSSESTPTPAQSEFIRRRLCYALDVHAADIDRVDTWIIAIDRGDHGPASYCKIDVTLASGERVSTEGTEKDFYLAVHRAADQAGWQVSRSLGRRQRRQPGCDFTGDADTNRDSGDAIRLAEAV